MHLLKVKSKSVCAIIFSCLIILIFSNTDIFAEKNEENTIRFGVMLYFFSDVNLNDAKVAMNNWVNQLLKEYKTKTKKESGISLVYFDDINELLESIKRKQIDIIVLSTFDYILYDFKNYSTPVLMDKPDDRLEKILLVNKNSNAKNLNDLKSKIISLDKGIDGIFSKYWLNMICKQNGINDYSNYFSSIISSQSSNRNIMELFFGQADACLTTKFTYLANTEMNPQFKNKFDILYSSELVPYSIFCIRNDANNVDVNALIEITANVVGNTTMKSMLELFKKSSLIKFNEKLLEPVYKLVQFNKQDTKTTESKGKRKK